MEFLFVDRLEVSQKAAEVDTLTDHLSEEKKRSRELQWAVEKQRCQTGRKEESEREELEVRRPHGHLLCVTGDVRWSLYSANVQQMYMYMQWKCIHHLMKCKWVLETFVIAGDTWLSSSSDGCPQKLFSFHQVTYSFSFYIIIYLSIQVVRPIFVRLQSLRHPPLHSEGSGHNKFIAVHLVIWLVCKHYL